MSYNDQIMEIYLKKSLYYFDFDLTTGIVEKDILDRENRNYTRALKLTSPCSFDALMRAAYRHSFFRMCYIDTPIGEITAANLLHLYESGQSSLIVISYSPILDQYSRVAFYLVTDETSGKPHCYVCCMDITDDEKNREPSYGDLLNEKEEIYDIIDTAEMGVWHIYMLDGQKPRLKATPTMYKLMGVDPEGISEEDAYEAWHSRIKKSSLPSVKASMNEMIENGFSENTYTWCHPVKGDVVVRCGGTSRKAKEGGYVLRGYHSDITETANAEAKQKQLLAEALEELKKQKLLLQEALDDYKEADYDRRRDFLTGLRNRQDMFHFLQDVLSGKRERISAMFMMDIDSFKLLNDHYGHTYGDECLKKIGAALNEYSEKNDIYFYRYGGEEMLGIAFGNSKPAAQIADELVKLVPTLDIKRDDMPTGVVTISLGYTTDNQRYEKMIDKADTAMYKAKGNGKNQAVCFEEI